MAQECDVCGRDREGRGKGKGRKGGQGLVKGSDKGQPGTWASDSQSYYRITVRCFSNFMRITYTQCVLFTHFRLPVAVDRHAFEPGPCLMLFWRRHINRKAGPELKDRKCAPPGTFYVNVLAFVCLLSALSPLPLILPLSVCACLFVFGLPYLTLFFCLAGSASQIFMANGIRHMFFCLRAT